MKVITDQIVLQKADIQKLYEAFIKLCDFAEEEVLCGNCPLWSEMCGNPDKTNVEEFSKALMRIRESVGIPNPSTLEQACFNF